MRSRIPFSLALLLVTAATSPALAAWPNSPFTNLPVCTAAVSQFSPVIVSDGAGGAIVAWYDLRSGGYDIYAQHLTASGVVDPAWPANGRALCTATGTQQVPTIVSDGAGGAIVAWADYRSGLGDIYAQRVLASGVVDPAWPVDGRALCTAAATQSSTMIVSDGAGGAIVTWHDQRSGPYDIYAQRVLASGVVDPSWPVNGRAVCAAAADQFNPQLVPDGAGGAIVTWYDHRAGNDDIYAQHVLASGVVDAGWPVDGRALCTAAGLQVLPMIATDGSGGAIVTWVDQRSGTNYDLYAEHVLASGTLDTGWPVNGRALCTAVGDQYVVAIISDGAGGAIATWQDFRSTSTFDIYAQHVLQTGAVDPAWPLDGRAVCTAAGDTQEPTMVSDGAGGAIVAWQDSRNGSSNLDIFAQHVFASGTIDALWPVDGRALSTAGGSQTLPVIASDGAGGAIVTWQDIRTIATFDIYAQRVARFDYLGTPEAEIVGVDDVPNDQGGEVKVSWNASYLDEASDPELDFYDVLRSVPTSSVASMKASGTKVRDLAGNGFALRPGDIVAQVASGVTYYWEFLASVTPRHYLGGYSYIAPTLGDSVAGSNPKTAFMVVARNSAITMYWPSQPASGYSVDDLAPAAPAPFTGEYAAGATHLHWNRNTEADLAGYRLYRGTSVSFVPGPGNLIAAPPDTGYADASGAPYIYKLTAIDVHGNESPVATLMPSGALAVDPPGTARALSFAPPSPNPTGGATTLRYVLPRAERVRLTVYDAAGRLVRELVSGTREVGEHAEAWDLRDAGGRSVGAGLYFARLECEGKAWMRRVAVTR